MESKIISAFYYFYGLRSLPSFTTTYSLFFCSLLSNVCPFFHARDSDVVCVCVASLRSLCLPSLLFSTFCDCCTSSTVLECAIRDFSFFLFQFISHSSIFFSTTYFSISITLTPHTTPLSSERTYTNTHTHVANEMTKKQQANNIRFRFYLRQYRFYQRQHTTPRMTIQQSNINRFVSLETSVEHIWIYIY